MVKLAYLLILSALIIWLAGSGCIGNNAEDDTGIAPDDFEAGNGALASSEMGLTPTEIEQLDSDMAELEDLLKNASMEEEIVIEEL